MDRRLFRDILTLLCATVAVAAFCAVAAWLVFSAYGEYAAITRAEKLQAAETIEPDGDTTEAVTQIVDEANAIRINAGTIIIYEYLYTIGNTVETTEEPAPYFMLGMDRASAERALSEWTVTHFTPEAVTVRKHVNAAVGRHYIVGEFGGYVAVYYVDNDGQTLKEITGRTVTILPDDEQERLRQGILVIGSDKLAKVMEDYNS
jgi:hypothetical protein